ncbi:beta-ketoacyl synthase N-terminal-like domain-containing protein [Micromonospora andamanensis]|uniref:3-oxoacyl-[acyl-carrier-protein] synthase 2 n=1 Tax=Micromonospora andamanensis TaxID=1287068 RepID=A0ABQ4HTH1_9ACTN|nr:beta-ketoacyl synthase N-terminal-like domain-containing protein [Micromonospora andamanensis]GIJ08932.1 3-oxoacyl-[acyl-carrier-protein] synthase 2 [Micromonospora andamanensis]
MPVIAASTQLTCFGDGSRTWDALTQGRCGARPFDPTTAARLNVGAGYPIAGGSDPGRAAGWLVTVLRAAVAQAGVDAHRERVVVVVGTGLRQLADVEHWALTATPCPVDKLHFGSAVRAALPGVRDIVTLANACSAGGHALAMAQDLVDAGEADVAVAAAADTTTLSMQAMIGRVADRPTERVRPFDRDRTGVLLGDGAAAVVVAPAGRAGPRLARLLATGLSCDAVHETAPDVGGMTRAMRDALHRADREARDVRVVVAHGTGTALNDPAECRAIHEVILADRGDPWVTALKGAIGHTSGAAALCGVDVALRGLRVGAVPPVVGLGVPLAEADGVRLVRDRPVAVPGSLTQVNSFGFGGVNAVTLLEPAC